MRYPLGNRFLGDPARIGGRLALLCQAVFEAAVLRREELKMIGLEHSAPEGDLIAQVVSACHAGLDKAIADPSSALQFARGLGSALDTLRLVEAETARGPTGIPAVIANADMMIRGALLDVLKHASDPAKAEAALAGVLAEDLSPRPTFLCERDPGTQPKCGEAPLFSTVANEYIATRESGGASKTELQTLRLRLKTFLDIIGDKPVTAYFFRDLQTYVNRMQFWPSNTTKRQSSADWSAAAIIAENERKILKPRDGERQEKPLAEKTMKDGYVSNIKTMMRFGMADHDYRDPFARGTLRYPTTLAMSKPRSEITVVVLNKCFELGVASGCLDTALLPLLAGLTSRRLGLLLYLRGSDIRNRDGVWIAQTADIVFDGQRWKRAPIKTEDSMTFFVLHEFLDEIGFIEWARAQEDNWLFAAAHEHADPAKYMSQLMNRLLTRSGAVGGNTEVFHCLRGDAITAMRSNRVDGRTRRLQAGHAVGVDEHELYGFRSLPHAQCVRLAKLKLDPRVDRSVFLGLDFDALAKARRSRGRPSR